jgi:hypothetical protein
MKHHTTLFFLSTSALTAALALGSGLAGCRGDSGPTLTGGGGAGPGAASSTTAGTGGSTTNEAGTAQIVAINQITDPTAPGHVSGEQVRLNGVVAMSIKFLVSKGSEGSCLWGVFVSSPGLTTTAPNTGILVTEEGTPASASTGGTAYCPVIQAHQMSGGLFPDDTAPGDVFDIEGLSGAYVPSTCGSPDASFPDNSNVAQYQLSKLTTVSRTSTGGPVPAPAVLTAAQAAAVAGGSNQGTLDGWGGVLVTVDNVQAVLQEGMTFDSYGHMLLNDGLQVGDKLYYVGDVKATDICYAGPQFFSTTPSFTSVTGFVYLDYCTWGLSPRDKCHDLTPPSEDCASVDDAGADAGPAVVCMH